MAMQTTAGQAIINAALPEDLRDYTRVLDKNGVKELLGQVAKRYPEKYREISFALNQIGRRVSTATGGNSFDITDIIKSDASRKRQKDLQAKIDAMLDDDDLGDEDRKTQITKLLLASQGPEREETFKESLKANNPLAIQVLGAGRGSKASLTSILSGDRAYEDPQGNVLPIPIMKSYSEGLSPAEYWAATYGARTGGIGTKLAVADAGYFSKLLQQVSHRLVVVGDDAEEEPKTLRGLPVDTADPDNEGSLLAQDAGGYPRNTPLTPKILRDLTTKGIQRLLVRSPAASSATDGIYGRDAGIREFNRTPNVGESAGIVSAQAIGEPVSQGSLGAKHGGGVAGQNTSVTGFAALDQLINSPETFKGGATHAETDGYVSKIAEAPGGGYNVFVGGQEHYVPRGRELKVTHGQEVEAGDMLSDGIPVPHKITQLKGIGEARRYFTYSFKDAMKGTGANSSRRNIEMLARGLFNHVRFKDVHRDHYPEEVIPYNVLERDYEPRDGAEDVDPATGKGMFLEKPYLHYTIGTRLRPSVIKTLQEFGVKSVTAHREQPPFEAEMVPAPQNLSYDEDPYTRMLGSGHKKSLLDSVHRGLTSDARSTSFVPARIQAHGFGNSGYFQPPKRD